MNLAQFPSALLEEAVNEFAQLPGIGRKTALRLVLFLLKRDTDQVKAFSNSIIRLKDEICYCKHCHNISDTEVCGICAHPKRDHSIVCVVENIKDVMAVENTMQYFGVYHVLGGIISPVDGIGPNDIELNSLFKRIGEGGVNELILALPTTMEGDTTNFYIYKKLKQSGIKITTLARGVSIGDELEYTDEVTLGRSLKNRTLFEDNFS
ncbi:recombination mediator RecR [Saccharicrinis sp. FJH54]|uniref:recombination mediator RecR n=1 Tax=Saccharicrinis sp. FJH54 TaxID=3344665 RepID=UPI0035D4234E